MPRGDGTGPPWGSGPGTGRGVRGCLGSRDPRGSKISGSRVERYVGYIEMLVPLASSLVMLFKKLKAPSNNIRTLTHVDVETDHSKYLKGGDDHAER
jgi:hypothetical protein